MGYQRRGLVLRLAVPILISACLAQTIVPVVRIAASYRAVAAGLTPMEILALSSAFAILPVFVATSMGRYNDRHGAGRAALAGAIAMVVACIMFAIPIVSLPWLLIASAVLGLGQTLQITAIQGEISTFRSPQQRDRMVGNLMVWQAVGQVVAPLVLSAVSLAGTDMLVENMIAVSLALSVLSVLLGIVLFLNCARPVKTDAAPLPMRQILSSPGLVWIMVTGALCVAVQDLTLVYMPVVGVEREISPSVIGLVLTLFALGQMVARVFYGTAMRKIGKVRLMVISVIVTGLAVCLLATPISAIGLGLCLSLSGIALGFAITSSVSLTMQLAPATARATSLGLRLAINRAGQFAMPLAAGMAASLMGAGAVFLVTGALVTASGLLRPKKLKTS